MLDVNVKLPEKIDENLGKALVIVASAVKDITSSCSKVTNLIVDTPCTLLAPLSAHLKGKSYEIACKYLPFQNQIEMRKEISQLKMAQYVLENLADKEQNNEELPPKIEDTDNLFAIQTAVSETTDEDFIKFWARLYTEEACKPNTVSKKTVNLCKDLNKDVVKALEEDIFPYCDECGFYFGDTNGKIDSINKAVEYGFLRNSEQKIKLHYIDVFLDIKIGQYYLYVLPGYDYQSEYGGKILTTSALEIRKCLKLQKNIDLNIAIPSIERAEKVWKIDECFQTLMHYTTAYSHKFFIMERNKIIYPDEFKNKDFSGVCDNILTNIEYKKGYEKFVNPDKIQIVIHD